jgi:hypothetical protein
MTLGRHQFTAAPAGDHGDVVVGAAKTHVATTAIAGTHGASVAGEDGVTKLRRGRFRVAVAIAIATP